MGYRDDFYAVENIVGYSGTLGSFPTIYFIKGNEFGHITQQHPSPQNVGRTEVMASKGYSIGNEMVGARMHLVEKVNGKVFHTSRSTLTRVDPKAGSQAQTVALLAQAIYTCPGEKYISCFTPEDFDTIDAVMGKKADVMAELLNPPIGHLLRAP